MEIDEIVRTSGAGITRRTIIRTGGKLAYSAPLIAATMKMGSGAAAALSPVICRLVDPTCVQFVDQCPDTVCFCRPTTEGDTFCSPAISCGDFGYCETSADCNPGHRCTLSTCCDREPGSPCCPLTGGVCAPPCDEADGQITGDGPTSPA